MNRPDLNRGRTNVGVVDDGITAARAPGKTMKAIVQSRRGLPTDIHVIKIYDATVVTTNVGQQRVLRGRCPVADAGAVVYFGRTVRRGHIV